MPTGDLHTVQMNCVSYIWASVYIPCMSILYIYTVYIIYLPHIACISIKLQILGKIHAPIFFGPTTPRSVRLPLSRRNVGCCRVKQCNTKEGLDKDGTAAGGPGTSTGCFFWYKVVMTRLKRFGMEIMFLLLLECTFSWCCLLGWFSAVRVRKMLLWGDYRVTCRKFGWLQHRKHKSSRKSIHLHLLK